MEKKLQEEIFSGIVVLSELGSVNLEVQSCKQKKSAQMKMGKMVNSCVHGSHHAQELLIKHL